MGLVNACLILKYTTHSSQLTGVIYNYVHVANLMQVKLEFGYIVENSQTLDGST